MFGKFGYIYIIKHIHMYKRKTETEVGGLKRDFVGVGGSGE